MALIIFIYTVTGIYIREHRPLSFFLAGMFLCALIRELDSTFDTIFDGAWQTSVSLILIVLLLWLYTVKDKFWSSIADYIVQPSSGILLSGILIVMVFSRFFGRELLWIEIMGDGFIRSVKNAVEESVELLGYFLCLVSAFEYFWGNYLKKNYEFQVLYDDGLGKTDTGKMVKYIQVSHK